MGKEAWLGRGRKALILLLLVTAVLLVRETGYFGGWIRVSTGEGQTDAASDRLAAGVRRVGAASPEAAVVCLPDGGRFGAAWDGQGVTEVLHRFSADFAEALGSAGAPETVPASAMPAALSDAGVFLRFDCPQPLELLASWLGTDMNGGTALLRADAVLLCAREETAELYLRSGNGDCFRCTTAVPSEGLRSRIGEYSPNTAAFAFETEGLSGGDGLMVLPPALEDAPLVRCVRVKPGENETDALLEAVGMNSRVASSYTEADDTAVYVDGDAILRLAPDGSVSFRGKADGTQTGEPGLRAAVNTAWLAAERSIGTLCGEASLRFAGAETAPDGTVTLWLDYAVNGISLRLAGGHAAEISVRDGTVIGAKLQYRSAALTQERTALLPCLQAAAIAAAEDTAAVLVYAEEGDTVTCTWVRSDG